MRYQTSSLVIALSPYSESSQLVQLLTREYGFVSALARGSHRDKSAFGGALDLLTRGRADLSNRKGSDLELLHAFPIERAYRGLRASLDAWLAAGCVLELLKPLAWPKERAAAIFDLSTTTLDLLEGATSRDDIEAGLAVFLARWLRIAGFEPRVDACAGCGRELAVPGTLGHRFSSRLGGLLCDACSTRDSASQRCSNEVVQLLRRLLLGATDGGNPSPRALVAARTMLDRFAEDRIERPLIAARWFTDGVPGSRRAAPRNTRGVR